MSYARFQPMRRSEDLVVFCEGKTTYNAQMVLRDKPIKSGGINNSLTAPNTMTKDFKKTYTHKNPTNIITFDKVRRGSVHPTQKPVALMEYLIKTYTNEGETVLDFTAGSGTTGVAAQNTRRKFILIEKGKEYYQIAYKRLKQNERRLRI